MSPKEIRRARRVPLIYIAAAARTSETTARLYEADPESVTSEKREALARVYAALESADEAAGPTQRTPLSGVRFGD